MKLYLKECGSDCDARFYVLDELGNHRFSVTGEITGTGGSMQVLDLSGVQLARIKQRNILFVTRYLISVGGENASLIQSWNSARPLTRLTGVSWHIRGDLMMRNFDLVNVDHSVVMTHGKRWTQWGDCYEMTVTAPENELMCLCIAVCVDNAIISGEGKVVAIN